MPRHPMDLLSLLVYGRLPTQKLLIAGGTEAVQIT
jgi:hypothetical protein